MGKPEGRIEDYLIARAKRYGCMCVKFTSPSTTGVPDRVVIGHGKVAFVELKAPGEAPRPRQRVVIRQMREHGALVYVIDAKPGVDAFLEEMFPGMEERRERTPSGPATTAAFVGLAPE